MTILTLAKSDTPKMYEWKQKLQLTFLPECVAKIQIGSRNVQQITQQTGRGIRSQSGGKWVKLPRLATFKIQASSYLTPIRVKHTKTPTILHKIITNSTKQSPSSQTNSNSVSQANRHISWNSIIQYGFHNSLTQFSIQRRVIPIQLEPISCTSIQYYSLNNNQDLQMFGSLKFHNQWPKYASIPSEPDTNTPYSSWYAIQKNICQEVRFIALPSVPSPPVPCKFIPPGIKYIALHTILNNISWISAQSKAFSRSHNSPLPESLLLCLLIFH